MLIQYFHYQRAQMNSSRFPLRELWLPQWWGSWLCCTEILVYSSDNFLGIGCSSWWDRHYKISDQSVFYVWKTSQGHIFFHITKHASLAGNGLGFLNHRNIIQMQMKTTSPSTRLCPLALLRAWKLCCSACRSCNGPELLIFLFLSCGAREVSDTTLDLMAAVGTDSVAQRWEC